MPDNLPARRMLNGIVANHDRRTLIKQMRALQASTSLEMAQVRAEELVEAQKIEALESVGHVGLAAASSLTAHRRFAAERDPTAVGCLDHLTETTVRAIGDRIERFGRRLG